MMKFGKIRKELRRERVLFFLHSEIKEDVKHLKIKWIDSQKEIGFLLRMFQ